MLPIIKNNIINIIELFASVQGETSFSGIPTVFVRTAACNLRCSWCDTTYSFGRGNPMTIDSIIEFVKESGLQYVCITGGEPLLQEHIYALMTELCDLGYIVTIETGGSLPTDQIDPRVCSILDIKCPGSKMDHKNYFKNLESLRPDDEVKFVIMDETDYSYAKEVMEKYKLHERKNRVLFSPVHGVMDPQVLVKKILDDRLHVRLNLQIHKFIWTPETKGV